MAVAWHSMDAFLGTTAAAAAKGAIPVTVEGEHHELPATGGTVDAGVALGAVAAGLAARRLSATRSAPEEADATE